MAFCDYGILQNTSGIWDWLAESLNISEWSKKDYAGLQELSWCLAKMRCHSISCTSALFTLLCPTSSELPAAQSGSANAGIIILNISSLFPPDTFTHTLLGKLTSAFWENVTSDTTRSGHLGRRALLSPGVSWPLFSPFFLTYKSLKTPPGRGNTLEMYPISWQNKNGTEDPAVPPLDVGLKAARLVFAGWQFEIYGHGRRSLFSLRLPTDGVTRAVWAPSVLSVWRPPANSSNCIYFSDALPRPLQKVKMKKEKKNNKKRKQKTKPNTTKNHPPKPCSQILWHPS